MKNGKKSIGPNPIQSEATIRMNPKPSFQSESIRARIRLDGFLTVFHQRYKTFFGLVRDDSHWLGYRYRDELE